jgi:DNA polymerase-3 subunit beta
MQNQYLLSAVFDNKTLNKALNIFQNILEKKSSIENLSSTKIVVSEDGEVIFTGLNTTVVGIKECNAIVDTPGQIIINAHILYDIVKKISHPEISIHQEPKNNTLVISAGKSLFKIPLQDSNSFPTISTDNFDHRCSIKNRDLFLLLDGVLFAVSANDIRQAFCGVKFGKRGDFLEAVGTDGHRLGISRAQIINLGDDFELDVIVPRKTIQEIIRQIKENPDGETILGLSQQKIGFFMENNKTIIISKLIHSTYPNYQEILKQKHDVNFRINSKMLAESLERCMIILDEKDAKAVCFSIKEKEVNFTAQSDNKGYIHETVDDYQVTKDDIESGLQEINIMVNAFYLHEIVKNIKSDYVLFAVRKEISPILIKEDSDSEKMYYLMPMSG